MAAFLLGILLVIVGVALWLGGISLVHAAAIALVITGVVVALYYVLPASAYGRRP